MDLAIFLCVYSSGFVVTSCIMAMYFIAIDEQPHAPCITTFAVLWPVTIVVFALFTLACIANSLVETIICVISWILTKIKGETC